MGEEVRRDFTDTEECPNKDTILWLGAPLSFLPPVLAGSLFIGLSATLLAWTLQRDGRWRLWIVLSAPWWWAIAANQWSLLLTAAVLTPVLQGLAALKPNLGIGILVYQPRWQPLLLGAVVAVLISLLVLPTWPLDWSVNLQRNRHHVPLLLLPFGPLLLLTATRWHNPRAVSLRTRLFSAAGAWLRSGCPWSRGALGIPTIGVSVAQLAARRRGISAWQATNMDTAGGVRTGCSYRHLAHIVAARRPPTSAEWRQHG